MADYEKMKVPDLKRALQVRGLLLSGNKADLIARLQEDDKKSGGGPAGGEDEIDWDEDDNKTSTTAAAAAVAAGGQGQIANPVAVPNQELAEDPARTTDFKVTGGQAAPTTAGKPVASGFATSTEPAAESEETKQSFSIGIGQSNADKEAEKRAARAKRFGITEEDEAKKLAERAKKFGLDAKEAVVKGLDEALPERRAKRGRDAKEGGDRRAKRQTPDRRTEPKAKAGAPPAKKASGKITDDPTEKAKAEARAKRFNA